jgi:2-phosphosulfolactate phosphatase
VKVQTVAGDECAACEGTVVVIDVLRAFTTAAYAFAGGVKDIVLVDSVEEAFALRDRFPDRLLMGEVNGRSVAGFDLGNSPAEVSSRALNGCRIIHRSTAGTRAAVLCAGVDLLLAGSLVCATATARYVAAAKPDQVSFVATGRSEGKGGDDDLACAEYMATMLAGNPPDRALAVSKVLESKAAKKFNDPAKPDFPPADLDLALVVDRFDFAMRARMDDGLLVLQKVSAPA